MGICDVIIMGLPWNCGEDCGDTHGWHAGNYWIQEDGTYSYDEFGDGDHVDVEADDVPTTEQVYRLRRLYAEYVVDFGTDPLGIYSLGTSYERAERYVAKFRNAIGGPILISLKRAGLELVDDVPHHVAEYLCLTSGTRNRYFQSTIGQISTMAELEDATGKKRRKNALTFTFTLHERYEYANATDRIVRSARHHVKMLTKILTKED